MPDYYQIGPLLDRFYHLYPTSFGLVPNEERAEFGQSIFYDNARIPDLVPGGEGSPDGILRPSGYKKGDSYTRPADRQFFNGEIQNPFVSGWGRKIANGFWVEIDLPFDWSTESYRGGVFEQLNGFWDSQRQKWNSTNNGLDANALRKWNRIFVWCISLEFAVTTIVRRFVPTPPRIREVADTPGDSSFESLGRVIPISKGARRIQCFPIWALGIEAGDDNGSDPTSGNWAVSAGYKLDPDEDVYPDKVIADGRDIWSSAAGWLLDDMEGVDEPVFYPGSETQEPDQEIINDKGVNRVNAFRGQMYMRFTNVPLAPFGNRYPQIDIIIRRVDEERISFSGALENVGTRGGVAVVCENIDHMADGVVFIGFSPRDILERYRKPLNYRIIDGAEPIVLKRREINDDLMIDHVLTRSSFVDAGVDDPVVPIDRDDQSNLASTYIVMYTDVTQNFQVRPQQAQLPRFPMPFTETQGTEEVTLDFAITAVEALEMAYGMMYRARARRITSPFTVMPRHKVQEGDVLQVPTDQGTFVMDVARRTLNPDNSVTLVCEYLLAEDTATLTADAGDISSGVRPSCYYPQIIDGQSDLTFSFREFVIVDQSRVITGVHCDGFYGLGFANTNIATKLSHRSIAFHNVSGFLSFDVNTSYAFGIAPTNSETPRGPGDPPWPDTSTWLTADWIYRIDRTNVKSVDILKFPTSDDGDGGTIYSRGNVLVATATRLFLGGSKLIDNNEITEQQVAILTIVDLANFSADDASEVELPVDGTPYSQFVACTLVCGDYVIAVTITAPGISGIPDACRIHRYSLADDALVDFIEPSVLLGRGISVGDYVYLMPYSFTTGETTPVMEMANTTFARVHVPSMEIDYFDIADDPNVFVVAPGTQPWTDGTYMYFLANNLAWNPSIDFSPGFYNAPYVARRLLENPLAYSGFDLTTEFDNIRWQLFGGDCDSAFHYLIGQSVSGVPRHAEPNGAGCILKLSKDFAYSIFYPATGFAPANDDFPGATISLGQTKAFTNEWATKQAGEPDHLDNPGGASVWWSFTPTASGKFTVSYEPQSEDDFESGNNYVLLAVYVGAAVDALTLVAGGPVPDVANNDVGTWPHEIEFYGFAGITYRIVLDGWYGDPSTFDTASVGAALWYGAGSIALTALSAQGNDDFEDALTLAIGSPQSADNALATKEAGEPDHAGNAGGRSLWWKITITDESINALRLTTDSDRPLVVGVYTDGSPSGVGGLVEVASGSDEHTATDLDYAAWVAAI